MSIDNAQLCPCLCNLFPELSLLCENSRVLAGRRDNLLSVVGRDEFHQHLHVFVVKIGPSFSCSFCGRSTGRRHFRIHCSRVRARPLVVHLQPIDSAVSVCTPMSLAVCPPMSLAVGTMPMSLAVCTTQIAVCTPMSLAVLFSHSHSHFKLFVYQIHVHGP